ILDIGGINNLGEQFHCCPTSDFIGFIRGHQYLCGHNLLTHDLPYLQKALGIDFADNSIIDTLYWSPLLFPNRPYHRLLKDDKLQTDEANNPLNDAQKAKDLFYDEVAAFKEV